MWDASQYEKFRNERTRPFFDLLSRIPEKRYRRIVDLGCGTGDLTAALAERWPEAAVTGVDLSEDMLKPARARAVAGRLEYVAGDLTGWAPQEAVDLIVSNAAFQWVTDHEALFAHVVSYLGAGGVLAVQVPSNFSAPSHVLLRETVESGPWNSVLKGVLRYDNVMPASWYVETAWKYGMDVDAWETVYQHVLPGDDPVLEWMKGTALRPILKALDGTMRDAFVAAYAATLRVAFPTTPDGTIFPFSRLFFVAKRR